MSRKEVYRISGKKYVEDGRFDVFADAGYLSGCPDLGDELLQRTVYEGEFFIDHELSDIKLVSSVVMEYIADKRIRLTDESGIIATGELRNAHGILRYVDLDSGAPYSYSEDIEVVIPE